jgi:hypothetical protein
MSERVPTATVEASGKDAMVRGVDETIGFRVSVFFDICKKVKKRILESLRNGELLVDLVRGRKRHASEKRDRKSENERWATEDIRNKMARKLQTGDEWTGCTNVRGKGKKRWF